MIITTCKHQMMFECCNNHKELAVALVELGANIEAKNNVNQSVTRALRDPSHTTPLLLFSGHVSTLMNDYID